MKALILGVALMLSVAGFVWADEGGRDDGSTPAEVSIAAAI